MKQLIFSDPSGRVYQYVMEKDLADEVSRKLKMSNLSLRASIAEEQRREATAQLLRAGVSDGIKMPPNLRGEERK